MNLTNMIRFFQKLDEKQLTKIASGVFILWVVAQIVVIAIFWGKPQYSDHGYYMRMALDCFSNGEWYPMHKHIYNNYIWTPGLINFLILQLKIFGTLNVNMIFNLLMNIGIAAEIYILGKKIFSRKTAKIALIFWFLLISNTMITPIHSTDLPFVFFALGSLCLCLYPKYWTLVLAGIALVLGNWFRPLALFYLVAILLYMLLYKYKWQYFFSFFTAILISVFIIGKTTENKIGHFVYQSTTSGYNLIMTANDEADGTVQGTVFKDSTKIGWIENNTELTFAEKDKIWKERSVEWIKHNPVKFSALFVKKIVALFVHDSWAWGSLTEYFQERSIINYLDGKVSKREVIISQVWKYFFSLTYYILLLFFAYALLVYREKWWTLKKWFTPKGILLFFIIISVVGTCIFPNSPRYHYPLMFAIVLIAAYGAEYFIEKSKISQ